MPRWRRILGWGAALAALLVVGSGAGLLLVGRTDGGRALLAELTAQLTGGAVTLRGLGGHWPNALTVDHLELRDGSGVWLTADRIALSWHPFALLRNRVQVDALAVDAIDVKRRPATAATPHAHSPSIPRIDVAQWNVRALELGAAVAGRSAVLTGHGIVTLHALNDAVILADLTRIDGDGSYVIDLRFDAQRLDASLRVKEPAGGPLENILQLPGLGALSGSVNLHGPRNGAVIAAELDAGELHGSAQGSLDLAAGAVDLTVSVHAPALQPRPDLAWRRLALDAHWRGDLRTPFAAADLAVDGLQLPGNLQLASLHAELQAAQGRLSTRAVGTGLHFEGSSGALFAADPLTLSAWVRLDEANHPFELQATHRWADLKATGNAATPWHAELALRWKELAPLAAATGVDLRGSALLRVRLQPAPSGVAVSVDGGATLRGGTPGWSALLGAQPTVQASGRIDATSIIVDAAQLHGAAGVLTLRESSLARLPAGSTTAWGDLQLRWRLHLGDLGWWSPALAGSLDADGSLAGRLQALAADATATARLSVHGSAPGAISARLRLRGLPAEPAGGFQADGMLDGAPLHVNVETRRWRRDAGEFVIRAADWKSAHAAGMAAVGTGSARSQGQLRLQIADLGDIGHLLGVDLHGRVDGSLSLTEQGGPPRALLRLTAEDLASGGFAANISLNGAGTRDALHLDLAALMPAWRGAPAQLHAAADLNLDQARLQIVQAALTYRGVNLTLSSPASLSLRDAITLDQLHLAAGHTVVELGGELAPALDLHGGIRQLDAELVDRVFPDLLAAGSIAAQAQWRGSLAAPQGQVKLDATGIRFRADSAAALPPLSLHATSDLKGDSARLDVQLSAGAGSRLNVAGDVPLDGAGATNLSFGGTVDLALASPLFEARGEQVAGRARIDMQVTGTPAMPQLAGSIALADGQWRDYGRGVSVTGIVADLTGAGPSLAIKSFTGHAASGELRLSGSCGILQAGMPVALHLTATDAQPIASSLVTATLDADVDVKGTLRERIDVTGNVLLHRTVIGIPNSLPPDVVVLNVRHRGSVPMPTEHPLAIGLDLTLRAPQEMLVQGRGLDAELGGEIHLGGTTDEPQVSGGFDLQRGSFSLAGNKLTFTAGRVSFEGAGLTKKIDPSLDFTASSTLIDSTITLRITGAADSPVFDFSSNPAQPQDEIMAHLFFGENAAQLSALQAAQIGGALATLSGVTGEGLNPLTRLQRSLGLDRLSFGAAAGTASTPGSTAPTGASVAAGRYLTKRIYVEGKQSTTGTSQVQVDVDITRHLKVQTRLGNGTAIAQGTTPDNDPGSSIGLSYQFEY
jgi:translocation and assembly module TamB